MNNRYRKDFGNFLNELGLNGIGIEIGVAEGNYSEILLKTSNLKTLYLLDIWETYDPILPNEPQEIIRKPYGEMRYKNVIKNMAKYGDRTKIIRGDSKEVFKQFPDYFFDFIYIDADHSYENALQDINNWYPKCKINGVFAGHDYINEMTRRGWCGVKQAVDEFFYTKNIIPSFTLGTRTCPSSWYLIKI
jgi:hypothetical protein